MPIIIKNQDLPLAIPHGRSLRGVAIGSPAAEAVLTTIGNAKLVAGLTNDDPSLKEAIGVLVARRKGLAALKERLAHLEDANYHYRAVALRMVTDAAEGVSEAEEHFLNRLKATGLPAAQAAIIKKTYGLNK